MSTKILKCTGKCKNDFQDKRYGVGNRVHNSNHDSSQYTCTVCGNKRGA